MKTDIKEVIAIRNHYQKRSELNFSLLPLNRDIYKRTVPLLNRLIEFLLQEEKANPEKLKELLHEARKNLSLVFIDCTPNTNRHYSKLEDVRDFFNRIISDNSAEGLARAFKFSGVEYPKFSPGDLVRLKSGGPIMTVSEVETVEKYGFLGYENKDVGRTKIKINYYYYSDRGLITDTFYQEELEKAEKEEGIKCYLDKAGENSESKTMKILVEKYQNIGEVEKKDILEIAQETLKNTQEQLKTENNWSDFVKQCEEAQEISHTNFLRRRLAPYKIEFFNNKICAGCKPQALFDNIHKMDKETFEMLFCNKPIQNEQ